MGRRGLNFGDEKMVYFTPRGKTIFHGCVGESSLDEIVWHENMLVASPLLRPENIILALRFDMRWGWKHIIVLKRGVVEVLERFDMGEG